MKVCLITDSQQEPSTSAWLKKWKQKIDNISFDLELVQFREFWIDALGAEEAASLVDDFAKICRARGASLIINGSLKFTTLNLVDGVHFNRVTIERLPEIARNTENTLIFGYSAHSVEEARLVTSRYPRLNYLFLSPIFTPLSKVTEREPLGLGPLRELSRLEKKPIYALGGINKSNSADCIDAGAYGVAGISLSGI